MDELERVDRLTQEIMKEPVKFIECIDLPPRLYDSFAPRLLTNFEKHFNKIAYQALIKGASKRRQNAISSSQNT